MDRTKAMARKIYDRYSLFMGGLLNLVSPTLAGRFVHNRNLYRAYAAGMTGDMDQNFRPRLRSGDADVKRAYKLVAARCRDQVENNALISGAIRRICNNVVRSGIYPKFNFIDNNGELDREANKKWRKMFQRWSRYCDATGHGSYGSLQKLGLRHMWMDGQYFIHRIYDTSMVGIVPLRLELLEFDQLDALVDGKLDNGNVARKGIEYTADTGKPVAYHFYEEHPGDYMPLGIRSGTRRIPAADIIHVWERRRISQYSGISWLAAVVMESFRMEDFRHITQDAARIQSIFAGFLKSAFPDFRLGQGVGGFGGQATPFTPADTGTTEAPTEIKTGIQGLPQGTEVQFAPPSQPGNNYEPFVKDSQRWQSVGSEMSFEAFSNNYTDSSYASARSGSLEERIGYGGQQQLLEEIPNAGVVAWFIEAAYLANMAPVKMTNYAMDPHYYHEMASGQFPGWSWVDPNNDANASEKLIDLSLDTRRHLAAQRGRDWDSVVDELKEEEKQLIELYKLRQERQALEGANNAT